MRMPNLTQALRVRKALYHLRGLPLPIPMTVPEFALVFAGSALSLVLLAAHLVVSPLELVLVAGVVGIMVYALRQESIDGKTPGQWLITALRLWSSPAVMIGERPDLERDMRVEADAFVLRRRGEDMSSWTPGLADLVAAPVETSVMTWRGLPQSTRVRVGPEWADVRPHVAAGNGNGHHRNGNGALASGSGN